jgi:hypothetical protein
MNTSANDPRPGNTMNVNGSTPTPPRPGDQAPPGTPGTGEAVCPRCGGSGQSAGEKCPLCQGTGRVNQGIGGG